MLWITCLDFMYIWINFKNRWDTSSYLYLDFDADLDSHAESDVERLFMNNHNNDNEII